MLWTNNVDEIYRQQANITDIYLLKISVLRRNGDFSFFLQSVGFPFGSQGPGSSRNFSLLLSHYKAIENGNQTVLSRTCGKNDVLGSKHIACVLDG